MTLLVLTLPSENQSNHEMDKETIKRFQATAPLKLPTIIKTGLEDTSRREVYEDYASLVFKLPDSLSIEDILDDADESFGTILMYRHVRSWATSFGESFCVFQEPGTGEMFQICGSTNPRGLIDEVDVKIYSSLEVMMAHLHKELKRVEDLPGETLYTMSDYELMSLFL